MLTLLQGVSQEPLRFYEQVLQLLAEIVQPSLLPRVGREEHFWEVLNSQEY